MQLVGGAVGGPEDSVVMGKSEMYLVAVGAYGVEVFDRFPSVGFGDASVHVQRIVSGGYSVLGGYGDGDGVHAGGQVDLVSKLVIV